MINAIGSNIKELLVEPVAEKPVAAPQRIEPAKSAPPAQYTDSINNSIGRPLLVATLSGLGTPLQVFNGLSTFDRAPLPKPRPTSVIADDPYNDIYGKPPAPVSPIEGNGVPEKANKEDLDRAFGSADEARAATQAYTTISQIPSTPSRGTQVNVTG